MVDPTYEYEFIGGESNEYSFLTIDKVRYAIKFVPSSYLFDGYPELDIEVFEMHISIAANPLLGNRLF